MTDAAKPRSENAAIRPHGVAVALAPWPLWVMVLLFRGTRGPLTVGLVVGGILAWAFRRRLREAWKLVASAVAVGTLVHVGRSFVDLGDPPSALARGLAAWSAGIFTYHALRALASRWSVLDLARFDRSDVVAHGVASLLGVLGALGPVREWRSMPVAAAVLAAALLAGRTRAPEPRRPSAVAWWMRVALTSVASAGALVLLLHNLPTFLHRLAIWPDAHLDVRLSIALSFLATGVAATVTVRTAVAREPGDDGSRSAVLYHALGWLLWTVLSLAGAWLLVTAFLYLETPLPAGECPGGGTPPPLQDC